MPLDHPLISGRYFFPRPGRPTQGAWEVTTGDGERLVCARWGDAPGARTVVYFHGNGETVADHWPEPASDWLALGVNLVVVAYRGYGGSSGSPKLAAQLDDTRAVFDALGLPAERLIAFGRSLGSLYATEFVARYPDTAGLILESGIADPLERILLRVEPRELGVEFATLQSAVHDLLNQQAKLAGYRGPTLILHARGDTLVEPSHALQNHAWAAGPKRLVLFERGDHNSILWANHSAYFQEIKSFLGSL